MTLDIFNSKMYRTTGSGDIRRANLDGLNQEILIRNLNFPTGIALDVSNGHLYWVNTSGGEIRRANLDASGEKILISGLSGPAFLTVDFSPLPRPDSANMTVTFVIAVGAKRPRLQQTAKSCSGATNMGRWRTFRPATG